MTRPFQEHDSDPKDTAARPDSTIDNHETAWKQYVPRVYS
jgi:hypothetical protein